MQSKLESTLADEIKVKEKQVKKLSEDVKKLQDSFRLLKFQPPSQ